MKTTLTPYRIIHVSAQLMSIILFLVWGYVFVMHIFWFLPPVPAPPLLIWIGQGLHLVLLVSYVLSFWKEKVASILMVTSAFVFFFIVAGSGGAIAYFLLSILPAILFFIASRLKKTPLRVVKK